MKIVAENYYEASADARHYHTNVTEVAFFRSVIGLLTGIISTSMTSISKIKFRIKDSKVSVIKTIQFFHTTPKTATQQNNEEKKMVDREDREKSCTTP